MGTSFPSTRSANTFLACILISNFRGVQRFSWFPILNVGNFSFLNRVFAFWSTCFPSFLPSACVCRKGSCRSVSVKKFPFRWNKWLCLIDKFQNDDRKDIPIKHYTAVKDKKNWTVSFLKTKFLKTVVKCTNYIKICIPMYHIAKKKPS